MGKGREATPPMLQDLKDYVIEIMGADNKPKESFVMQFLKWDHLSGILEFRPARCGITYKKKELQLDPKNTTIKYYEYV